MTEKLPELLNQEIATVDKNPFLIPFNNLLRPNDDTLQTRGGAKGLKIYDEIERDCHAFSVLQKRKLALIARPVVVDPATPSRADKKAADFVREQLAAVNFDKICMDLLDALLKGYAVSEIMWKLDGGQIRMDRVKARDQRRFAFDVEERPRLLTRTNLLIGEAVPERKFIVHRFGDKDSNPYGLGLGTRLFWPVYFKRQGIQFWLTFADKFGAPTAVGKYPPGTSPADQDKLLAAISALANDTGVIIPENMAVEFLEAARSGSINTYETLCRYMDEEISKAVLGETLSTSMGKGGGSFAASRTHNEVRLELTRADADLLSDTLNATLCTWLTELNFPGANPPRVRRDCGEPEDLKMRSDRDRNIGALGFKPTLAYIQETYGEGWEAAPAPIAPPPDQQGDNNGEDGGSQFAEADPARFPDQTALDAAINALDLQPQAVAVLMPVVKAIQSGQDENALLGLLAEALPGADESVLTEKLTQLLFAATVWGKLSADAERA
jgi:phage gp29-like protein